MIRFVICTDITSNKQSVKFGPSLMLEEFDTLKVGHKLFIYRCYHVIIVFRGKESK